MISAGSVHGNITGDWHWLAVTDGGKIVTFNDELNLSDDQKNIVSAFVAEANGQKGK